MHTRPMAEHEGTLSEAEQSKLPCPKCRAPMLVQLWASNCGGFEDCKYVCPCCQHVVWIDGIDS